MIHSLPRHKILLIIFLAIAALAVIAGAYHFLQPKTNPSRVAGSSIGGPYELVNQDGETVTDKTFKGQYKLIYFGFTFCPAICPTELSKISDALDQTGSAGEKVTPIFISIDPERDTPRVMHEYVSLFHPRLVGLTGTPEQVATAAHAYKVYYAKAGDMQGDDYVMDHSSYIYFMSPDDELLKIFRTDDAAQQMADYLKKTLR